LGLAGEGGGYLAGSFGEGHVDVEEAKAADGASEVMVEPEVGEKARVEREPVEIPVGAPREDEQDKAKLKDEDSEADA
jgi:hypothetical protein